MNFNTSNFSDVELRFIIDQCTKEIKERKKNNYIEGVKKTLKDISFLVENYPDDVAFDDNEYGYIQWNSLYYIIREQFEIYLRDNNMFLNDVMEGENEDDF